MVKTDPECAQRHAGGRSELRAADFRRWLGDIIMTRRNLFIISIVLVWCALCLFAADWTAYWNEAREIKNLSEDAFCVVQLEEGDADISSSFTISETVEHFEVGVLPYSNRESLWLFLDGGREFSYRGTSTEPHRFGVGRNVPPGTYTVTLRQASGTHGGIVVITDRTKGLSAGITGWQIISRAYLCGLAICAIWAFVTRKSSNPRQRMISALAFQYAFLGFLVMFFFLLFHEGGHALGEIYFGRYDSARSDFWGIHGHPHSGGTGGPGLEPWQGGIITSGAIILPLLVGWLLFLPWRLFIRCRREPTVRFCVSGTIGFLLFSNAIMLAACLLGVFSDNHFDAIFIAVLGPDWLIKTVLWCAVSVSVVMLWQIVPEIVEIVKTHRREFRELQQSHATNETGDGTTSQPTARADRK